MKHICFTLVLLSSMPASSAGIKQLIDSLNKPPAAPQPAPRPPAAPQPPKSPTGK